MQDYNELPQVKSLHWLELNFPYTENPADDTDKMCNAINVYSKAAIIKIISLAKELDIANAKIKELEEKLNNG